MEESKRRKGEVETCADFNVLKDQMFKETKTVDPKNTPRSMGIGKLGQPNIAFVHKFRWTLQGNDLPEHFIKKVDFDFVKKIINFETIEVICKGDTDIPAHKWIEGKYSEDTLVFTTYDSCGNSLYEYKFTGLSLLEATSDFDYASSDESSIKVKLLYKQIERRFLAKKEVPTKKDFYWEINTNGTKQYKAKIFKRPELKVEETEVNFLNSKMFVAGKTEWQQLIVGLDKNHVADFIASVMSDGMPHLDLFLYQNDGVCLEQWTLFNVDIERIHKSVDNTRELTIRFNTVKYHNYAGKPYVQRSTD